MNPRIASVLLTLCGMLALAGDVTAELSEGLKKDIEASVANYKAECEAAKELLLKEFDTEMEQVRGKQGTKAENTLALIEALQEEKKTFETTGHVPFSSQMRPAMAAYIKRISLAGAQAAKVYDKAITALTKNKDDAAASAMIREKDSVPLVIGKWHCTIKEPNGRIGQFTWTLYSDGVVNRGADDRGVHPKSWTFGKNGTNIVITNVNSSSPKGGFKDTCVIHWNGQKFDAKNQLGGTYVGQRID